MSLNSSDLSGLATAKGLGDLPLFSKLPPSVLDELSRISGRRLYGAGQTVVHAQEVSDFVGCVSRGILRVQATMPDGQQHIVGLLVENDLFGRVFDGPHKFAIEAATDTEIRTFRRGPFEDLLTHSVELERLVLLNILNELDRAREWMLLLANHRVTGRLAGFLFILCRRWGKVTDVVQVPGQTFELEIPVSRTDLAQLLGTRPESLSRAVHALARSGIIRIESPYKFEILKFDALVELAGGDAIDTNQSFRTLQQRFG